VIVVESGGRRAAIGDDEISAQYDRGGLITGTRGAGAATTAGSVRLLVEVDARMGGIWARALIGALFSPPADVRAVRTTEIWVQVSSRPLELGAATTCASMTGSPLVPGLPDEFAQAVLVGLTDPSGPPLPEGTLLIDRAGHDEVGSSSWAFGLAARVLVAALSAALSGDDAEAVTKAVLERR
jgi:hypothetical protein